MIKYLTIFLFAVSLHGQSVTDYVKKSWLLKDEKSFKEYFKISSIASGTTNNYYYTNEVYFTNFSYYTNYYTNEIINNYTNNYTNEIINNYTNYYTNNYVTNYTNDFPSGGIILWSGSIISIPTGWALCDGQNGTPNLTNSFILGAGGAKNPGDTGGSSSYTPSGTVSTPTFTGTPFSDVINHTHTISVTDPGHAHITQRYPTATGGSSGFTIDTSMSGTLADNTLPVKTNTTGITASSANPGGGVSSITPAGTVSAPTFTGNNATVLPPYYALAYIMKL